MHTLPTRPPRRTRIPLFGLSVTSFLLACGGGGADGVLDREVFIAAFVDLRADALLSDENQLSEEERAQVLAEHGVSEEDLMAFAEHYGRDVAFMRDLWNEVEQRLDEMRPLIDESGRVVRPIRPGN